MSDEPHYELDESRTGWDPRMDTPMPEPPMSKQRKRCARCGDEIVAEGDLCLPCQGWEIGDHPPEGAAACPMCGSVYVDGSHAFNCCAHQRRKEDE